MPFRLYRIAVVLSVVFLAACTINKTKYTSGIIGCPERMITIAESSGGFTANTWTARCDGKTFYCTYAGIGNVTCSPSMIDE